MAGGKGTRLLPFTKVTNKHLLPVSNMPMIEWPIRLLLKAGITDIMIVTGTEHAGDVFGYLGSGKEFGANFTYRIQDEANGIAGAVALAEDFVGDDEFITVLGDNITWADADGRLSIHEAANALYLEQDMMDDYVARVFLKEVKDPERFGVAITEMEGPKRVMAVTEKSPVRISDQALMGIYHFMPSVFDVIRKLKPSARGELEITEAIQHYIDNGDYVDYEVYDEFWSDAGTMESYKFVNAEANKLK